MSYLEYKSNLVTHIDAPRVVHLSITTVCNWDCVFCAAHNIHGYHFKTNTIYKILDRIAKANVSTVVLYGGEPTLHPDFIKIGKYARDLGLDVGIITNGARINDDTIDKISEIFSVIAISIHSFKKIHEALTRRKHSFDQAINALELVSREGIPLFVNITVTPLNLFHFDKFIIFLNKRYNILSFNVNRASFAGVGKQYTLNKGEVIELVKRVDKLNKLGINVKLGVPVPPCILPQELRKYAHFCSAGVLFADISGDGSVRPCSNVGQADVLGNILENSLQEIWNSEKIVKLRTYEWLPDKCKSCSMFIYCFGGCKRSPDGKWRVDPIIYEEYKEYYIANPYIKQITINNMPALVSNVSPPILLDRDEYENIIKILRLLETPKDLQELVSLTRININKLKQLLGIMLRFSLIAKVYRKDLSLYYLRDLFFK